MYDKMTPPKMVPCGFTSRGIMMTWMARYGSDMSAPPRPRGPPLNEFAAHRPHAIDHVLQLAHRDEPRRLREAAVRRDVDALRVDVFQHRPQPLRHQLRR